MSNSLKSSLDYHCIVSPVWYMKALIYWKDVSTNANTNVTHASTSIQYSISTHKYTPMTRVNIRSMCANGTYSKYNLVISSNTITMSENKCLFCWPRSWPKQVLNLEKGTATILAFLAAFLSAISAISQSSRSRVSSSTSSPCAQISTSWCLTRAESDPTWVEPTMIKNASDITWNVRISFIEPLIQSPWSCNTVQHSTLIPILHGIIRRHFGPPTPKQKSAMYLWILTSCSQWICFLPPWKLQPMSVQLLEESATNLQLF